MITTTDNQDLSQVYNDRAQTASNTNDAAEMEAWLHDMESADRVGAPVKVEPVFEYPVEGRPLPEPKPARVKTDDTLGRPQPKGGKDSMIKQAAGGVEDAMANSGLFGLIDPMAQWLNDNVYDTRYGRIEAPNTTPGKLVRGLSEFFTGFVPALKGLRAAGMTGNIAAPMLAGAIADFTVRSPHEGRLADLWNEFGLPKNVLTEYLKSDPSDTATEARFKNAVEGVGLGAATEGVIQGARLLRAARGAPGVKKAEDAILKQKYGEVAEEDFLRVVGDSKKNAVEVVPVKDIPDGPNLDPRALIRGGKGKVASEDFGVYVNFARFDEPEQIKFAIGKMAEAGKGQIDEATRGVITQKETQALADELGMTVQDIMTRRKGQPFNAEEAVAARNLWAASGEKLVELAKLANKGGPTELFAFRRQMAVHSAIQAEVIGARTETARALASWKIEAKGGIERARAIEQVMSASGGGDTAKEMARRLAILAEEGADPAAIGRFAQRGFAANSVDAVKAVWINGLLSSPKTHVVNTMSNTIVAFQQIYERGAAGYIREFTGGEGVVNGEAVAMAFGMVESLKDAFRLSAKALRTGETGLGFNKIDLPRTNPVSSEAFRISKESGLGRTVDFLGTATGVPGRLLQAEDEFFKTIGYRMELRAQALRTATQEGHKGADLAKRISDIVDNPPEHIRINAADAALYNTFTSEVGWFGRSIMGLRNADHPANPLMFVLPFVRTPVNIARYAFERTPLAPLVGQWRADIAAGGARQDLALARMATGTSIMAVAMDLADSGLCSGKGPGEGEGGRREALQRQGWMPYSCKVGDRWYSYNRADPFGMTMGFASDISEAMRKGEIDQDDVDEWYEVAAMAIATVSQVTISKTYLEGFANFVEVMMEPKRRSRQYIQDLMASFLPMTSGMAAVKNVFDPVSREAESPAQAVQARIAGLSDNLPPRRNLWGEEMTSSSGLGKLYDAFSPVASREQKNSPVDREMVRMGMNTERIGKKSQFNGVEMNMRFYPSVYDEYVKQSGNELKHPAWGMGAKDYLNAVVSGTHPLSAAYKMLGDEGRRNFIQTTIQDYRKLAQQKVLGDPKFSGFAKEHAYLQSMQQQNRMPILGE